MAGNRREWEIEGTDAVTLKNKRSGKVEGKQSGTDGGNQQKLPAAQEEYQGI